MRTESQIDLLELKRLLAPLFRLRSPEGETVMGRTAGEGLVLPDTETILKECVAREKIQDQLTDTLEWIFTVVHMQWLPGDLPDRLFAVRGAVNREDAWIGAWSARERSFQIAVTRERVHLLVGRTGWAPGLVGSGLLAQALVLAHDLLRLPARPDLRDYDFVPLAGAFKGRREIGFARHWHETLLILTDGAAVKYSILKFRNRESESERTVLDPEPVAWFPREDTGVR